MKKKESKILYFFIPMIIILGVLSFVWREKLAAKFLHYDYAEPVVNANKVNDALSLELLSAEKVKALKDNVSVFDYEDFNKTQDALAEKYRNSPAPDLLDEEGNPLPKKAFFRVNIGNSNPFPVPVKEEKK